MPTRKFSKGFLMFVPTFNNNYLRNTIPLLNAERQQRKRSTVCWLDKLSNKKKKSYYVKSIGGVVKFLLRMS